MADDKTLSQKIIYEADALQQWDEIKPFAIKVENVVKEYSELIDGISTVFTVVGFVWGIYSSLEKGKEDAAKQQEMVNQITQAVHGMITRATAEIEHHIDMEEVLNAVKDARAVLEGFRLNVVPFAKTIPLTGFDTTAVELLRRDAQNSITTLRDLIDRRAEVGDGYSLLTLYRNLQAVVQCKLTLDRWRYGLTQPVMSVAVEEMKILVMAQVPVLNGLWTMSDKSFSQGIVLFHRGGHGRPEFTHYSIWYKGKPLPGGSSNPAPVAQSFIAARSAARDVVVPQEVFQWFRTSVDILGQVQTLQGTAPPG